MFTVIQASSFKLQVQWTSPVATSMLRPNRGKHGGPHTSATVIVRKSHHRKKCSSSPRPSAHRFISLTTMSSSRSRSAKRQRTFGAPTEDDDPAAQLSQARYQNAVSTRTVGGPLPALTTCCARAFVKHIQQLSADPHVWEAVLGWLKLIPEPLVPKLFAMLKSAHPTLLKSEFIVCVSTRARLPESTITFAPCRISCVDGPCHCPATYLALGPTRFKASLAWPLP